MYSFFGKLLQKTGKGSVGVLVSVCDKPHILEESICVVKDLSQSSQKDDLRVSKTKEALERAMVTLLSTKKLEKISVHALCAEAHVSRTAFYSHFLDKYDILRYTLERLLRKHTYTHEAADIGVFFNMFFTAYENVIRNIIEDASETTLAVLREFFTSIVTHVSGTSGIAANGKLSIFLTGGLVSLLQWQLKNRSTPQTPLITYEIKEVLEYISSLQS